MGTEAPGKAPDRAVEAGRGALFIGVAKIFFMVSGFAQKVLLARVLPGSGDFGELSIINNVVSVVNNTVVQGTTQSVSKFTAEEDGRVDIVKRAGLRLQAVLGTAVGLGFFLAAPLVAQFYKAPQYTAWLRVAALIPFFYSFYSVFVGSANGLRRFRAQAGFDIGFAVTKTVLMVAGAVAAGVTGAFGGFVTAALVILLVSAKVMGLPRPGGGTFPVARLARFMGGMVVYTLLINVALNYDLILLRRFAALATTPERAAEMAGLYEAVRNYSLLPYQFLLVITFVIFPLVSRSTFQDDRETTRVYVRQTLRYALILSAAMGVVLAARPTVLLSAFGKAYVDGAAALPLLVTGICALSLLGVSGSIINASGGTRAAGTLVATTVVIGAAGMYFTLPRTAVGIPMLVAAAGATAVGMIAGMGFAVVYIARRFGAGIPALSVARVAAAIVAAVTVARFLPTGGKILGLATLVVVGVVYLGVLIALREFGPEDRAKFMKVLRR